ncbi:MAG: cyclohexa-1,5-dienecarbonyl-CoA hydratase [Actinobacteria bacterium]|jgi:cyclohexa-1,5-dienecarbonyl-CoA hydratase|nr:cyclohexa-1,5-dienecarbonyl-CoA hydratase [Actinomycetota bacterium]MBT3688012.1 cyclohexa-1,5-dienecarbonyl-CoA hydratase [Actinomycetota bacterium]MBT4036849.1 cyclohexa-1,5-dienecarbonyl-CoA hydratase [Actinomycetota bacterium]MBT4278521.1 cyclohexa-1,5-dienecarbonyl-CoA hydratase [Actinomycetota bacterium]MBT4343752.1 cyclohexa-1,5-dienecarbonyl-CoA hydratase [Actinomycetota bacterium]
MSDTWIHHDVSADGAVHTITLDRAPGNVIDIALCGQLRPAIQKAADSADGKVLVIRGAGRHFCFGASVEEHLPETAPEMLAAFGGVIRDLVGFPYPTVAGVQGSCLGGGLELVLACGIVIAEDGATLASPEIQLGVLAPAATALLSTRVAEDVLLTGRSLTADDGLRLGIVSLVVPEGGLDEAVDTFVDTHFVPRSAHSLRLATRAVRGQRQVEVGERLDEAERLYVEELLPTHDGVEGIRAFMEKRPPQWRNC